MADFTEKVALITGASSGIGKAIALELGNHGAALCLIGRRLDMLNQVVDHADNRAPKTVAYQLDLTVDKDIEKLAESVQESFGAVDILVHSAGAHSTGSIERAPVEDFDLLYRTNVRAPFFFTQCMLPMLKACSGQVVFINSTAGLNASADLGLYSASKLALKGIADSLRAEVNSEGLRVLSVYPGRTAGPLQEALHKMEGKEYIPGQLLQPEDVAKMVVSALRLPRTAEVTDIGIRPMVKPK